MCLAFSRWRSSGSRRSIWHTRLLLLLLTWIIFADCRLIDRRNAVNLRPCNVKLNIYYTGVRSLRRGSSFIGFVSLPRNVSFFSYCQSSNERTNERTNELAGRCVTRVHIIIANVPYLSAKRYNKDVRKRPPRPQKRTVREFTNAVD